MNTNRNRNKRKQRRSARQSTEDQQKVKELRKRIAAARQPGIPEDVEIRAN